MKSLRGIKECQKRTVASLAEAWIEIIAEKRVKKHITVASLAEAWIEIMGAFPSWIPYRSPPSRRRGLKFAFELKYLPDAFRSPPSRRRGLKFLPIPHTNRFHFVASLAEAWIEIEDNLYH